MTLDDDFKAAFEAFIAAYKAGARHSRGDATMLQTMHDHAVALGATCDMGKAHAIGIKYSCGVVPGHEHATKAEAQACIDSHAPQAFDDDTLLSFGGEIKALGEGKVGGYLVRFTDAKTPDLTGDFFSKSTDFGIDSGDPLSVYYNHGGDPVLKRRRLGRGTVSMTEEGVWLEAQLEMRDQYERAIYAMVESGKVGWSSGAVSHLVDREQEKGAYHIKHWHIGEASITPTPAAGPSLTAVVPLKTWAQQLDTTSRHEESQKPPADAQNESKAFLELELQLLEIGSLT